jgi:hypothetical protein
MAIRATFLVIVCLILPPSTYSPLSSEVGRFSEIAYESVNIGEFKCAVNDR